MATEAPTTSSQLKPRVRRIGAHRYLIESASSPGLGRQVDTLHLRCSCPAGRYARRCRHLMMALEYDAWRTRQQQAAPEPPASAVVPRQAANVPALSSSCEEREEREEEGTMKQSAGGR